MTRHPAHRRRGWRGAFACAVLATAGFAVLAARAAEPESPPAAAAARQAPTPLGPEPPSSSYLAQLPDGEDKRRFILDCTGCHLFDARTAAPRPQAEWKAVVERMLAYAGSESAFPVISAQHRAERTAAWLAFSLASQSDPVSPPAVAEGRAEITEFPLSKPNDLLHDVAIDADGRVVVTGMFSRQMLRLDPSSGDVATFSTPVGMPRAVELDARGDWWVLFGAPPTLGRYAPASGSWTTVELPAYPHSIALDAAGRAWFNGHFSHRPELLGFVEGERTEVFHAPPHPALPPVPYEVRVAPDGRVWMGELLGNRLIGYDPKTGRFETHDLPRTHSGPRRFDIDRAGILWVPLYSGNAVARFDPAKGRFDEYALPERDTLPYVARVDGRSGRVWIGTAAADAVYALDPSTRTYTRYALPSRGAMVRHLAIDSRNGDVWLAYGASPGRLSARIARLRMLPVAKG